MDGFKLLKKGKKFRGVAKYSILSWVFLRKIPDTLQDDPRS